MVSIILSTNKENNCAKFTKLSIIVVDDKKFNNKIFHGKVMISFQGIFNMDDKSTFEKK